MNFRAKTAFLESKAFTESKCLAHEAVFRGVSLDSFKNPKVGKGEVSMYGKGQRSGLCVGVLLLSLLVFSAGAEAKTY